MDFYCDVGYGAGESCERERLVLYYRTEELIALKSVVLDILFIH